MALVFAAALFVLIEPAMALSELKKAPDTADDSDTKGRGSGEILILPLPEPVIKPNAGAAEDSPEDFAPDDTDQAAPDGMDPDADQSGDDEPGDDEPGGSGYGATDDAPVATSDIEPLYDRGVLPQPVQRMRELIVTAAKTGDPEALRPLIGTGAAQTRLSFGGYLDDPIAYLREVSGDRQGLEVLAILLDVLDAGFVNTEKGTEEELFVWPYFSAMPLDALTAAQRVELLRIVTAGDLQDMRDFGGYTFFRVGIAPDGTWRFFLAGD